jgi:hypothetical protein
MCWVLYNVSNIQNYRIPDIQYRFVAVVVVVGYSANHVSSSGLSVADIEVVDVRVGNPLMASMDLM